MDENDESVPTHQLVNIIMGSGRQSGKATLIQMAIEFAQGFVGPIRPNEPGIAGLIRPLDLGLHWDVVPHLRRGFWPIHDPGLLSLTEPALRLIDVEIPIAPSVFSRDLRAMIQAAKEKPEWSPVFTTPTSRGQLKREEKMKKKGPVRPWYQRFLTSK